MVNREYITHNDKLYWVYRRFRQGKLPEDIIIEMRKFFGCDNVLRTKNQEEVMLVFVKEITEATIVD